MGFKSKPQQGRVGGRALIDRMKEACGATADAGLAAYLGVPPGTVKSWRHRNRVPFEHVATFAAKSGSSVEELLSGEPGLLLVSNLDPALLALAIDQAEALAREVNPKRRFAVPELAGLIASLYARYSGLLGEILAAGKITRRKAVAAIYRAHDFGEYRRLSTSTDLEPVDEPEHLKEVGEAAIRLARKLEKRRR